MQKPGTIASVEATGVKATGATAIKATQVAGQAGKSRVFWSGGEKAMSAATKFAEASGHTTLEMTRAGKNLTNLTQGMSWSEAGPMWQRLSTTYAKGVPKGSTVNTFLHNPSSTGVWNTIEKPILLRNQVKIIEHTVK